MRKMTLVHTYRQVVAESTKTGRGVEIEWLIGHKKYTTKRRTDFQSVIIGGTDWKSVLHCDDGLEVRSTL